jgi:hypothetical protein
MLKIEREQLAAQLAAVSAMLQSLPPNDHLGRIGFEARRNELQQQIQALGEVDERRAKVALFFGGDPVIGSIGIETTFGTNAMWSFQDMMSKVWSSHSDAQPLRQMGPIRNKEVSQLHITTVVHGSFGFLLEELDETEPLFQTPLSVAADKVTKYILSFADDNEGAFTETVEALNPRVFKSIRDFFSHMHRGNATFRIVEGEIDKQFDHQAIETAWRRAEGTNVDEQQIRIDGQLLGVIPVGRRFELQPAGGGPVVRGKISESFGETYVQNMSRQQFAGRLWRAQLLKKTIEKVGRPPVENYTLLQLDEISEAQQPQPSQ